MMMTMMMMMMMMMMTMMNMMMTMMNMMVMLMLMAQMQGENNGIAEIIYFARLRLHSFAAGGSAWGPEYFDIF
eukprot:4319587-Amphidinium_carterae.1